MFDILCSDFCFNFVFCFVSFVVVLLLHGCSCFVERGRES